MRNFIIVSLVALCLVSGCKFFNSNNQKPDWTFIAPVIEVVAQSGATVAFAQENVASHKAEICDAVQQVSDVLANYNDPNATFDALREKILAALNSNVNITNPTVKSLVVGLVDSVVSKAVNYVQSNYADYAASEQGKVVLTVSQSVAHGLKNACTVKVLAAEEKSFLFPAKTTTQPVK